MRHAFRIDEKNMVKRDADSSYRKMTQDELDKELVNAVYEDDISYAIDLIKKGADVNTRTDEYGVGLTILMICNFELFKLLIENGADVNEKDYHGRTALNQAVKIGDAERASVLIASEADVNIADWSGITPLMTASRNGDEAICRMLLDAGADVDSTSDYGEDAMALAENKKIERLLAQYSRKQQRLVELMEELRGHVSLEHNSHGKKGWIILNSTSMRTLDHGEEEALAEANVKDLKAISKKCWDDVIHDKISIKDAIRNAEKPSVIDDEGQYGFGFMKEGRKTMRDIIAEAESKLAKAIRKVLVPEGKKKFFGACGLVLKEHGKPADEYELDELAEEAEALYKSGLERLYVKSVPRICKDVAKEVAEDNGLPERSVMEKMADAGMYVTDSSEVESSFEDEGIDEIWFGYNDFVKAIEKMSDFD